MTRAEPYKKDGAGRKTSLTHSTTLPLPRRSIPACQAGGLSQRAARTGGILFYCLILGPLLLDTVSPHVLSLNWLRLKVCWRAFSKKGYQPTFLFPNHRWYSLGLDSGCCRVHLPPCFSGLNPAVPSGWKITSVLVHHLHRPTIGSFAASSATDETARVAVIPRNRSRRRGSTRKTPQADARMKL